MTVRNADTSAELERVNALIAGELDRPETLLGPHRLEKARGWRVRAFHPGAIAGECRLESGEVQPLAPIGRSGLFETTFATPNGDVPEYRLRFHFANGESEDCEDPYRFGASLGDVDLYLFAEGTHRRLWEVLGAVPMQHEGVRGVRFAVWAPRARRVSVVGDFCGWDGRRYPMRRVSESGIFELFLPDLESGAQYKFEIKAADGRILLKADPYGRWMEHPPGTASRVFESQYVWGDDAWLSARRERDWLREPISIYEVHLGSWQRDHEGRPLDYRTAAERLVKHATRFGFTHIELLPITEHPFEGSWGYQVSGYFAPTTRYGDPDAFRAFVDACHQAGIGVILDWVPAHFPKDEFALGRFDGGALYEYEDPRLGEHPDWGTLVFDFGRNEVRNFLSASALYWLEEFHVDGLRVDAVASMLYRDYSREEGDWIPNVQGGHENLEAVSFLRDLNAAVKQYCPGAIVLAEESTAWPGVSRPTEEGGLGFTFKWNLGWMHDTLLYFSRDPVHRRHHHDQLTFASIYEYTEHFVMPLSHDEVVHGKGSLLSKMAGDEWQKFANLRALYGYQYTRPGKKLLFMGNELAPWDEWNHDQALDWGLMEDPMRAGLIRWLEELGSLYRAQPCLWKSDPSPEGFRWIDCSDSAQSVLVYLRRFFGNELLMILNATPVPRDRYRVGAPAPGVWQERLCSDDGMFGGSDHARMREVEAEPIPCHGEAQSLDLILPPLSLTIYERETEA